MSREQQIWQAMVAQSFHPRQWFDEKDDYPIPMEEEPLMWVYRYNGTSGLWLVGFYAPNGEWNQDGDTVSQEAAAQRVHWLNGGK